MMSYWVDLVDHNGQAVIDIGNQTYNVCGMYSHAMGIMFKELNEKPAPIAHAICLKGIVNMLIDPQKYKKMEPSNGWGDYKSAIEFLIEIAVNCAENKELIVSIS